MDQRRLSMSDLVIGEPLQWDVFGDDHKLLLRKGQIIANNHQIDSLVQRGLFVDSHLLGDKAGRHAEAAAKKVESPSALRLVNMANKRLERLLYSLHNEPGVEAKILEVATALNFACNINSDVVLGCILLNQETGNYAVRHCIDTAAVALLVARAMQKTPDEVMKIVAAALTMNLGMLRQQDQLQGKEEALSEKESELIHKHPEESVTLLQQAGITDADWLSYIRHHHENEDGSGYPTGNSGQEIPQNAKIIALADRYCARISNRTYRKSMLSNAALRNLFVEGGKTIDSQLATYFIRELGMYLPGTTIRLQNGEIGVVTGKGHGPTMPVVHALIGPRGAPLSFAIKRDTAKELYGVREALQPGQASMRFSMQQLWGEEARM